MIDHAQANSSRFPSWFSLHHNLHLMFSILSLEENRNKLNSAIWSRKPHLHISTPSFLVLLSLSLSQSTSTMHNDLVCCIWIVFLVSSVAARSDKRDPTPPLETVVIPLSLSNTNRYSVSVDMVSVPAIFVHLLLISKQSPGSTQQVMNCVITTGTGYNIVAGVSCGECDGVSGSVLHSLTPYLCASSTGQNFQLQRQ